MFYTHGTLDRADHLRKDDVALACLRKQESTRLLPLWRGNVLVGRSQQHLPPTLATLAATADVPEGDDIFLGLIDDVAHFALSCSTLDDSQLDAISAQATEPDGSGLLAEFMDLRIVGPQVPANDGALLAYARGLIYWQENSLFCSRCGSAVQNTAGGHVKRCTNGGCQREAFPRTDPAVIMLVTDVPAANAPPRCLLGRSPAWPKGVFSTLAGFVEPGESLEQAVQREVWEEANIQTEGVQYIASQPWPFPRSIMLGFQARAITTDITVDPNELADARWFTKAEIATFGNWGDEDHALQLPRPDSIARFLIDRWCRGE